MILTLLPESWSVKKIIEEFKAPNYQVRQVKKLLQQLGILFTPNQKLGKNFHQSEEVSRLIPGIKDCISAKDSKGRKVKVSKKLTV